MITNTLGIGSGIYIGGSSGGGDPIDIDINSATFLTGVSSNTDIPVVNSGATTLGSKVGSDWVVGDITLTVTDQNANTLYSGSKAAGVDITQAVTLINTANPIKTYQTTSFATGDDGYTQRGRSTDIDTLDFTNPFGNTNRITDTLGVQTYANNIYIDWLLYNESERKVYGWYGNYYSGNWNSARAYSLTLVVDGFSNWFFPNISEMWTAFGRAIPTAMASTSFTLWSSTSNESNSNNAYRLIRPYSIGNRAKTDSVMESIMGRIFTLTELGL